MLARAPDLHIFSQKLIIRKAQGWQITEAGRTLLAAIENPVTAPTAEETPVADQTTYSTSVPLLMLGVSRRRGWRRRRRRRAAKFPQPGGSLWDRRGLQVCSNRLLADRQEGNTESVWAC